MSTGVGVLVVHAFQNRRPPGHWEHCLAAGHDVDVVPGGGHLDMAAGYGPWPSVLRWCADPAVRLKRV